MALMIATEALQGVPPAVLAFAAEQGVTAYLPAMVEMTRRLFPTAALAVLVEDDPEIANDRHIVLEVDTNGMTTEEIVAELAAVRRGLSSTAHPHTSASSGWGLCDFMNERGFLVEARLLVSDRANRRGAGFEPRLLCRFSRRVALARRLGLCGPSRRASTQIPLALSCQLRRSDGTGRGQRPERLARASQLWQYQLRRTHTQTNARASVIVAEQIILALNAAAAGTASSRSGTR